MRLVSCMTVVLLLIVSNLNAQEKKLGTADSSIPEEFAVYDTVIVFNSETYEETVTVTKRDSRNISKKIKFELELSGATARYTDTMVIFNPETYKESVHIYQGEEPIERRRIYDLLDVDQKLLLDSETERRTTEVEINSDETDFELFLENKHPALILSIVNSSGDIIMSKEIDANQRIARIRGQSIKSGTYKIIRSDAGKTVKLLVKE